jgi:peptidoglycan hydrolase-like protein with peptidoglycan-binding domain
MSSAARAQEKQVQLIKGLDSGDYMPYRQLVIEEVQELLRARGHYQGDANGVLDEATMNAIGEFQKANGLHVSGVPSPMTRRLLQEEET